MKTNKKMYLIIPMLILVLILSFVLACNGGTSETQKTETVEEPTEEEIAEETSYEENLTFTYTDKFPDFWGKVRMVEPNLASFEDVRIGAGEGILEGQDTFAVLGKLKGEQAISYCFNPDQGVFVTLSGIIVDKNSNIKWSQDGYLQGTGSYIKEGETREFLLINSVNEEIKEDDTLILIAHVEYGMIEDDETDVDKGVFAEFNKEIKNIIEEVTEETVEKTTSDDEEELALSLKKDLVLGHILSMRILTPAFINVMAVLPILRDCQDFLVKLTT